MSDDGVHVHLPATKRGWRDLMASLGIRPSKGLGQNFLIDSSIVDRIVRMSGIGADDLVVEVGPGLGILTHALARKTERVIAIERDPVLAAHIRRVFPASQVQVVTADAMHIDPCTLTNGESFVVAANLPYSAATAIVRHFLELARPPELMIVMVQHEVGERMLAQPPQMSILGVATQFYATGEMLFTVPSEVFFPPPKVQSTVLRLQPHASPLLPREEHSRFFRLVTSGFRLKRKTIANSMATALQLPKSDTETWLTAAGIEPRRRAETLYLDEWQSLYEKAPAGALDDR